MSSSDAPVQRAPQWAPRIDSQRRIGGRQNRQTSELDIYIYIYIHIYIYI